MFTLSCKVNAVAKYSEGIKEVWSAIVMIIIRAYHVLTAHPNLRTMKSFQST
jgi:hypothetical protein